MIKTLIASIIINISSLANAASIVEFEKPLTLKSTANINSQQICLQDLVEETWIKARCNLDKAACCRWSLEGQKQKKVSRIEVLKELNYVQFPGYKLTLNETPATCNVTQTKREITTTEIAERLVVAVQKKFGIEQDINVKTIEIIHPLYVSLQEKAEDWNLEILNDVTSNQIKIRMNITGAEPQQGAAQATVLVSSSSYVAKRTVKSSEELMPSDFELRQVDTLLPEYLRSRGTQQLAEFPTASKTRLTVNAGSPLIVSAIEKVPAVRSGETITLMIRSDSVKISTKGIVQTTASVGDTVSVAVPKYSKTFRGKLVEGKLVEVWL